MNRDFFRLWGQTVQIMNPITPVGPFTRENTKQLLLDAQPHSHKSNPAHLMFLPVFLRMLNWAAADYIEEKELYALNIRDAREELKSTLRQLERLQSKLDNLSQDARHLLEKTPLDDRKKLMAHPFQQSDRLYRISQIVASNSLTTATFQSALDASARNGSPPDNRLSGVLLCCYLFWTKILKLEFTLLWTERDVSPLTPAAEWCVKVCQTIDSNIETKKVRTAANKMQDFKNDYSNLSELPQYILSFLKHIKLLR